MLYNSNVENKRVLKVGYKIMNKVLLGIGLLSIVMAGCSSESVGPEEWTQYRMNSENNPVYKDGEFEDLKESFQTDNEVRATPGVGENYMFVGNHDSGSLNAFDMNTGEQIWKSDAPNWIHSEMVYEDGTVFVGYGNRYFNHDVGDPYVRGSRDSGVMALEAESGEELWNFETLGHVMTTPVIYNDHIYAITGDRHLYKIDIESGEQVWNMDMGSYASMSAPALQDGAFYFGGADPFQFYAVDLDTKEVLWKTSYPDAIAGLDDVPPAIYNNELIYTTALIGDSDHPTQVIYAMDIENGEIVWEKEMGSGENVENNKSGAPMIYNDKVFVASPITQHFYAYDAKTGEELWSNQNDYIAKAPPVADDGIVYFTDAKGHVFAFDVEDGSLKGVKKLKGTLAPAGPVIMNEHLIVGSQSSEIYTIPTDDIIGINEYAEPEE